MSEEELTKNPEMKELSKDKLENVVGGTSSDLDPDSPDTIIFGGDKDSLDFHID